MTDVGEREENRIAIDRVSITLEVAEASPRDVGRGLARLDPADIQVLGLEVGDVVAITGRKRTVARIVPAMMEDRGKATVQIDGITRENAQVGVGEQVVLAGQKVSPARELALAPLGPRTFYPEPRQVARLLQGLPAVKGDRVRLNLFASNYREFRVENTRPPGPVIVAGETRVLLVNEAGSAGTERITYEDIGGLGKALARVREIIELPLKYPEAFHRLGITAPKGVLLHGPPGTGKTLIARAVANETDAHFSSINGPEIIHKYYGESEARLREIFELAGARPPAIIFLDEIDAIAPRREEVKGDVEKRVVAQLLALMDGLKSRAGVIVIGATNLPDALDPALRRPGRFDREIPIGIPDYQGRLEIIQIHTRGMPLGDDVELDVLAGMTHGFVGADLQALCREAALACLRESLGGVAGGLEKMSADLPVDLEVNMRNFMEAFREVGPTATREFAVEIPNTRWGDVGGLEEVKRRLTETVIWPLRYPELFREAALRPPKGVLLHGPPGTGKTLLGRALANEAGVNFILVNGPALLSQWVGESEKAVRHVFRKARQAAPCIIFFDEIESLVPRRGHPGGSPAVDRVLSQLLTEIDGVEELRGVVVLAATNRLDMIDQALLRSGRLELHLELPLPDDRARLAILQVHTGRQPIDHSVDPAELAKRTAGLTGADLELICRTAALEAVRDHLKRLEEVHGENPLLISATHYERALELSKEEKGW